MISGLRLQSTVTSFGSAPGRPLGSWRRSPESTEAHGHGGGRNIVWRTRFYVRPRTYDPKARAQPPVRITPVGLPISALAVTAGMVPGYLDCNGSVPEACTPRLRFTEFSRPPAVAGTRLSAFLARSFTLSAALKQNRHVFRYSLPSPPSYLG